MKWIALRPLIPSKGTPVCGFAREGWKGRVLAHVSGRGHFKERAGELSMCAPFGYSFRRHLLPPELARAHHHTFPIPRKTSPRVLHKYII